MIGYGIARTPRRWVYNGRVLIWIGPRTDLMIAMGLLFSILGYKAIRAISSAVPPPHAWIGIASIAVGATLLLAGSIQIGRWPSSSWRSILAISQMPAALAAYLGLRDVAALWLMVIAASQIAKSFEQKVAFVLILLSNLAILCIPELRGPESFTIISIFIGVEIFAALTVGYSSMISRINAELLSARYQFRESVQLEERLRLSRELHDVAGHKIIALRLQLLSIRRSKDGESAGDTIETAVGLLDELLMDIRSIVSVLRAADTVNLADALLRLIAPIFYPQITLEIDPEIDLVGIEHPLILLRAVQEGLTNALRHSNAQRIRISLSQRGRSIISSVVDDGIGCEGLKFGNGLTGMSERLRAVGGAIEIGPAEPQGCRLNLVLPRTQLDRPEP